MRAVLNDLIGGRMSRVILRGLIFFAAALCRAVEPMTECTVDGTHYKKIFDVHETSDGRIAILYHVGGVTTDRANLNKEFLASWGIDATAAPKAAAPASGQPGADWLHASEVREYESLLNAGLIRRIGTTIYNLHTSPQGWDTLANAKVLSQTKTGSILEVPDRPTESRFVYVANLPMTQDANETVTVQAKLVGFQKRTFKAYGELNIAAYDYGTVVTKNDISPEAFVGSSAPSSGNTVSAWNAGRSARPAAPGNEVATGSGSGFFVSADGFFLTSYHVVAGANKIIIKHGGKAFAAEVKKSDPTNDIALLKVEGTNFKWLPLAAPVLAGLGQTVFTIGYPNPSVQGEEPKYSEGSISGLDGYRDDEREYQISVPVQPGNSGGPLCNAAGDVVGIVRAELTVNFATLHSGALPQNVNYAVKSKYALNLLKEAGTGIGFDKESLASGSQNIEAARTRAMDAAGMVLDY